MHRFYAQGLCLGSTIELPPDEAAHAIKVLRLTKGCEVELFDGIGKAFSGKICAIDSKSVSINITEVIENSESKLKITLYQGLPKADKMDFIVQKCCELGVNSIVPVLLERCVVKLDAKDSVKKCERWQRIALEAAKQSGRSYIPTIQGVQELGGALKLMERHELMIIPWEEATGKGIAMIAKTNPNVSNIGILIGSEGGITKGEVDAALAHGGQTITLGPRILRTETAGIVSIALLQYALGDLGGTL